MNRSIPHVMYQMNAHTCRPAQVFKLNHQFLERHTSDDDDFLKPDNANRRLEGNQMNMGYSSLKSYMGTDDITAYLRIIASNHRILVVIWRYAAMSSVPMYDFKLE